MKVYISGKIGEEVLSDATREKFAVAERMLQKQGHFVFNPTRSGLGITAEETVAKYKEQGRTTTWYNQILLMDLAVLETCDAIYLLKDWRDSPGARTENCYAEAAGKTFLMESEHDARHYLWDEFFKKYKARDPSVYPDMRIDHAREKFYEDMMPKVWLPL